MAQLLDMPKGLHAQYRVLHLPSGVATSLLRELIEQGFRVIEASQCHGICNPPDGFCSFVLKRDRTANVEA
jgi:hypothetical protein